MLLFVLFCLTPNAWYSGRSPMGVKSGQALAVFALLLNAAAVRAQVIHNYTTASIAWDPTTQVLVQNGGSFGRMVRLSNREILCAYEWGGDIYVRWSSDEGVTWNPPVMAASNPNGTATTPGLLVLQNGAVMLSYNDRPGDGVHPYTIRVVMSSDNGRTWANDQLVFQAGTTIYSACWEPAEIQLSTGEIQLYFSNGQPYNNWWQQITMMRSYDNGSTWSAPVSAIYTPQERDGMPTPVLLNNGSLVISIEEPGVNANFQPAVVPGPGNTGWLALSPMPPSSVYVGAPFLVQFPSGETVLSAQSGYGRPSSSTYDYSQMAVYIGDPSAQNFTPYTQASVPFAIASNVSGLWNALFLKNSTTVTAISSTTINGVFGLWAIDGRLNYPDGPANGITAVTNAAGGTAGPVSPGELVSIFGTGLVPANADLPSATVSFNGIPGSVSYVSPTQINAVVPDNVSGVSDVVVGYQGTGTYPYPLGLAAASPEIFHEPNGNAEAVAVNQDGSLNWPTNPATRGSIIELWATGQGMTDSETPYARPQLPVSLTIGGVNATIAFAGMISPGVLQLNVTIPPDAPTGTAIPLVLTVGSFSSKQATMISVQ